MVLNSGERSIENSYIKEENNKLRSIIESLKQTFLTYALDKIKFILDSVLGYLKISKMQENTGVENIKEMLDKNNDVHDNEEAANRHNRLQCKPNFKMK